MESILCAFGFPLVGVATVVASERLPSPYRLISLLSLGAAGAYLAVARGHVGAVLVGALAALLVERMRIVGLTGGISTGKSSVSTMLRDRGVPIVDADEIARVVVQPGCWAHRRVVAAFGQRVCLADGSLDRALLRKLIFEDPALRRKMNSASHLPIILEIVRQIAYWRFVRWAPLVVLDAPLLFETGLQRICRYVVVVACTEAVQTQRLMARDRVSEDEAARSIRAQLPLGVKMERADCVISNNGSREDLERRTDEVYTLLAAQAR